MKGFLCFLVSIVLLLNASAQTISPAGPINLCPGGNQLLTVSGVTGTPTYQWQLNTVNIAGATLSTFNVTAAGNYRVILNGGGPGDTLVTVIVIARPAPIPVFSFNNNNECSGTSIQFTSNSSGGTSPYTYSWNFGDAGTSNVQNPSHIYTALGCTFTDFTVILTVSDSYGCIGSVSQIIRVKHKPDVRLADIDIFNPFSNCQNNPTTLNPNYNLTVNNTSPSSACITSYTIDWGDGSALQPVPVFPVSHLYTQVGAFNLVVTALGSNGCINSKSYRVANQLNPAGGLGTLGQTTNLCAPSTIPFIINNWQNNSPGTAYVLNFGDNTSITLNHPLNATGVSDTVYHQYTMSSCPSATFTATLLVINACDSTPYTAGNIQVRIAPIASFVSSPAPGCAGQSVCFTNTTITGTYGSNCSTLTSFNWNFGDPASGVNNTSILQNPCHIFSAPGTYTVTLTSSNPCGPSVFTKQVCIAAAPIPFFTLNANSGCAPLAITTTNTSVTTNSCNVVSYLWSVSYLSGFCSSSSNWSYTNSTNASSVNPSFLFSGSGTYIITLALTNPCGTFTKSDTVIVKKPPTVSLSGILNSCSPASINPLATISNCGMNALTYSWSFPGGTPATSISANPGTIAYNTPGTYTVSLSVTNECGTTTVTAPITIKVTPVPVVPANIIVCAGNAVGPLNFSSLTAGAAFNWTNNNTAIGLAASGSSNPIPLFTATNTGTAPIVATITVTASLNGCSSVKTFSITVYPKPLAPIASTPVSYCQNDAAVSLTATATAGNSLLWYTTSTGGTGNSIAPVPLTTIVGTTIFYVSQINTATSCEGPRTAISVVINPSPVISAATFINPTTCSSLTGSITLSGLSASTVYTVNYIKNGVPFTVSLTSNASGVIVISNLGAGTYTNIAVTRFGCTSNIVGPFTLADPSAPSINTSSSNSPLCSGSTLNLMASTTSPGIATFNWTGPGGYTSALQNPTILNVTAATSGTYNVTVSINGCISAPSPVIVVVNQTPATPVASNNGPLCGGVGQSLNLSSSTTFTGLVSYSWTGPGGFTSSLQNPVITSVTTAITGIYSVTVISNTGNCPSAVANTNVIVKPTPQIMDSSFINPSTCGSATGSITLGGLLNNTVYVINYLKNGIAQTITISANAAGYITIPGLTQGTYSNITVNLNGCVSAAAGPFVLVDPNPPAAPVATSNSPLCSGSSLNLQIASISGAAYLWSGPNGFTSTTQNNTIPNVGTTASGTYSVTATVNNCTSAAGTVTVLINQTPVTPVAGSNSPLCSNTGASLNLNASTSTVGTITYIWTGPNGFNSVAQNPVIANVTTGMSGTYNVTATGNPGNCISAIAGVVVVVNPTPVIMGNTHTDPSNCGSSTGSISLSGLMANTVYTVNYTWTGLPQTASITTNGAGILIITGLAQGTYDNIIVVLNNCPSAAAGPITLTDPNPPGAPLLTSNSPVCSGNTLNLTASTSQTGTISYAWTGPNGFTSNLQNPSLINVTTTASGNYNVSVTVNDCISLPATISVLINPLPAAPVASATVNYCINAAAVPLSASAIPGNTLNWYNTATGGTGSTTAPVPATNITGTTNYYVSQVNNTTGCEGSRTMIQIIVNPDAIALFIPTDTIKCPPFNISSAVLGLQTYPANNSIYQWYINGVLNFTGINFPGHTIISEDDSVTVMLIAISAFGCKPDTMKQKFYTYKLPHPSFTLSDTVGCGPVSSLVLNTTANISLFTYIWDFGNGQTSSLAQPGTIVFQPNPNSGDTIYYVSLKIFSICDTITVTQQVRVKAKPKALFTPSITVGCSPMRVIFYNNSKGINNSYYWDFGDGTSTSTNNQNPVTHTYNTGIQDTFYIKLIATNECGTDSITYSVIAAPNNIQLNYAINGPNNFGCAPHTVAFINNTAGASSFNWDFGDGNTLNSTLNVDTVYHTYLVAGSFTVSLTAQNSCTDTTATKQITVFPKPNAAFIADRYTVCIGDNIQFTNQSGFATSYLWQFGDGGTSSLLNPIHNYTVAGLYTVKLIIYRVNAPGNVCTDTVSHQIQVVSSLPGWFSMSDTSGLCAPFTVTFVNQNRPSVTASWDFGDGNTGTGDSVVHTYAVAGIYTVSLTVIVPGGCTYLSQRLMTVSGPSGTMQYTGGYKCYPDPVRFEATAVNSNNLVWNFGDGNTLSTTQLVVFHNYANPGVYIPTLTLQNNAGCNYFIKGPDTIKVDKIDAGFTNAQQKYCGYTNVVFNDTSHIFFGRAGVIWNFGDGSTGAGANVNHVYSLTGTYTIQMIVTGISGCTDTVTRQLAVFVNSRPIVSISADTVSCTGQSVLFAGVIQSVDAINITQWTISNGYNSSGQNLAYTFATAGTYNIRLIAGTVNGCYDTTNHTIRVNPSPVISASASVRVCLGNSVQLNVTGAPQFQWSPLQGLSCSNCADPVASPVISTPYIVTGTNSFGCRGYDTVIVTVIQPLNMVTSANDTMCIGKSVNLMASGAATYTWTPAQGLNSTSISNPIASPSVTTTYRVVGYDGFNCFTDTAFIVVAVGKYPLVNLGPDLTLSAGTIFPLISTIQNGPVRTWSWTPDTDLSCSDCALPEANIKNNISYVLNATNIYGCKGSDTIRIKVFCTDAQMYIPNAFTPDGDGVNDILMVRGKGILSVRSFRIFNRWGEVVFEKNNFPPNNPAYGWDGRIRGVQGPPDVFVYTADVICENGTAYSYKGNVSIIK